MILTEIYLTNSNISHTKWLEFIHLISKYNGYFRKWKLIVVCEKSKIRYLIQSYHVLPTTLNNLESFILKKIESKEVSFPKIKKDFLLFMIWRIILLIFIVIMRVRKIAF